MRKLKLKSSDSLFKRKNIEKFDLTGIGPHPLIGIDEVGRGCIAGPVFAAAVIFLNEESIDQVTDSKLLSEARRMELAEQIHKHHHVSLGFADVDEIDELNILQASLLAMKRAVEGLAVDAGHLLIDGHQKIPGLLRWPQTTVIKGDLRVPQISAASIVAKVHRDQLMKNYSEKFPGYGFEVHKGYGTEKHRTALAQLGPCSLHRKSFGGVKEFFSDRN